MLAILHATRSTPGLDLLKSDLDRFGIQFRVYAMDTEFVSVADKLETIKRAIVDHPDEELLFLDAFDVRILAPIGLRAGPKPFFSTELMCWPEVCLTDRYPQCDSPWRFLNSGAFIATAESLRAIHEQHPMNGYDQLYWTYRYFDGLVELDTQCQWFQSMAHAPRMQWADYGGRLTNLTTLTTPAILHFNGQTEPWEPDGKTGLQKQSELYQDTEEDAKRIVESFTDVVNRTPWLKAHRDFAEKGYGCGERSFHWMWHLLVGEMPPSFKFLEVGVYKGQVITLVKLLSEKWGKQADVSGVTMLSDFSGTGQFPKYEDRDYLTDINAFHDAFGLPFDASQLIVGDSTDAAVIDKARERAPFDMVYIDAGHEYEYVLSDIRNYAPLVRSGGFLIMDDAANDNKQPWGYFQGIEPVTKATRETICADPQWEHVLTVMHNRVFRKC